MSIVCPTVTCQSEDLHEYRRQMERVEFAARLQVDLMDGDFAPTKSPDIAKIWFPEDRAIDLHLMYRNPADVLNEVIELRPRSLIVHAEANVHIPTLKNALDAVGILLGIALLQQTTVDSLLDDLEYADHVLVFSGDLGHFGGQADLALLRKVEQIRRFRPEIEIGWDGGINADNIRQLAGGGVDILNVGGFIQNADDPKKAFDTLVNLLQS